MATLFNATESSIVSTLDEFISNCEEWDSNEYWTKEIKTRLLKIGSDNGFSVAASGVKGVDYGEWLYDVFWYSNRSKLVDIGLAAEIEWGISFEEHIQPDFEKLLVARARQRLMIFQAMNENVAKHIFQDLIEIIDRFKLNQSGDRYLLIGYNREKKDFLPCLKVVK